MKEADEATEVSVEVVLKYYILKHITYVQSRIQERLAKYSFDKLYTGKSMYIDDEWASDGKKVRKRKAGAPKKLMQHKTDNEL